METIETKIKELLSFNEIEPVFGKRGSTDPNDFDNIMKRQDELMTELKALARAQSTYLGRIIKFQMADSYAVYVITKVNAKTVQVTWVKYCDAWMDDRLGRQGNLSKDFVKKQIAFADWWESETNPNRVKIKERNNV